MMSYTRTSSSTMLHGGAAFPPPPHLAYMQTNGNGIGGGGGGGSGGLVNGVCGAAPPTLSLSSTHGHSANGGQVKCECQECTYCMRRLDSLSIKCCECLDFHLCLKCFSMSAEIGEHKKDHNYCIISTNITLFDSDKPWTHKEELLLLQLIELYGFGNWDDIAQHFEDRSADECLEHYNTFYIYGNLGKYTFNANSRNILMSNGTHAGVKTNPYNETPWYTPCKSSSGAGSGHQLKAQSLLPASSMSSPSETVLLPPVEMSSEEQRALGYMPLRDDYERDYKNEAESYLNNLSVSTNQLYLLNQETSLLRMPSSSSDGSDNSSIDSGSELDLKYCSSFNLFESADPSEAIDDIIDYELTLSMVKKYCDCLRERQRMKQVAREYGLINNASLLVNQAQANLNSVSFSAEKKNPIKHLTELDRDEAKLKKFSQLMSASEYENLLENTKKHRHLRKRLQELKHLQSRRLYVKMNPTRAIRLCTLSGYNLSSKCPRISSN